MLISESVQPHHCRVKPRLCYAVLAGDVSNMSATTSSTLANEMDYMPIVIGRDGRVKSACPALNSTAAMSGT